MAELNPDVTGDTPAGSLRLTTQRLDYDGQWVTQVKVRQSTTVVGAITPQENVTSGVWTAYHDEPISDILVFQVTETRAVPGLYVPRTRDDLLLGPITGTRRLVENSGLTTLKTATYSRTYDAHENSQVVCWELIETNSDGTGSAGNPVYPTTVENKYDQQIGDVETTVQASTDLTTDSSFVIGLAPDRAIITEWEPINQFLRKKIIKRFLVPGVELEAEPETDDDGAVVTVKRQLDYAASITEGETVTGGFWTRITSEPYSGGHLGPVRWKVTRTRAVPGTAKPSTRIDDDGATVTISRTLKEASTITTSETANGTTWTLVRKEEHPQSVAVAYEVSESRPLKADSSCPIIREDKWNDQFGVVEAHFFQYVPDGTTKPAIGASYSTADTYVSDSITALTVSDPGSGYTTIPTLTVSTSPGGGTLATATVTNLQAVSATVSAPGTGYAFGDTVQGSTGTGTKATFTVTGGKLATLALNDAGTNYVVNDTITLAGGTYTTPGTLTVSTIKLVSAAINAAGSGYTSGGTVTLAGGTAATKAIVSIATLKLVGVSINAGGAGYAIGDTVRLDGGTASTKAVITVATVDGGGAILTFTITTAGNYTVTSTTHTSTATSGVGTGATFNAALYGILTFTITTAGSYTVGSTTFTQDSATGGGTGATFQTGVFGINTFAITAPGQYSYPAVTTFTAGSTSGSGINATFQTATYTMNQLTVLTGGAYTVIATNPDAVATLTGAGSGMTVVLDYGIGAVAIGNAGTLYYYAPTITPSYGSAVITPTMSAPVLMPGSPAGYVVDTNLLNTEHALIKRLVWTTMTTPPTRIERASRSFAFPTVFTYITGWTETPTGGLLQTGPFPGVNYTQTQHGSATKPARCTISYSLGPSGSVPATWSVITPGTASRAFPIGANTIHNSWTLFESSATAYQITEKIDASTPASYTKGQTLVIAAEERNVAGNFYEKRTYTITE